jgi:CheY-like chemotaxis protein
VGGRIWGVWGMATTSYRTVDMVLAEPRPEVGDVISAALEPRGLRDLVVCRDAQSLVDTLDSRSVDILLCDVELAGISFRETMQRIRHHQVGINPFLQIVATVGEAGKQLVKELIGAGVDDVIRRPMEADRIVGRFDALVRPRRPFAITESFIGPNRRQKPRQGDAACLMHVPHSLRCKLVEELPRYEIQQRIDRTWREISDRKSRAKPEAINVLSDRILAFYAGKGSEQELMRDLRYLVEKSEDLILRCEASGEHHLNELASSMRGVTRRIVTARGAGDKKTIKLMPDLSLAAHKSMAAPGESIETVREIAKVVRDYLEEQAAAAA